MHGCNLQNSAIVMFYKLLFAMADPAECWVENEIRYLQVLEYNAHAETQKVILETHFQLEAYF